MRFALFTLYTRIIFALSLAFCALAAPRAQAQSYNAGYAKYQRADFKGARNSLELALKSETSPDVLARVYKLLGICNYNLGDRAAASTNFTKALTLNPSLTLSSSEVIDDGVLAVFAASKPKPGATPPAGLAQGDAPAPSPSPPPLPKPRAAHAAAKGRPAGLRVVSNVDDAMVLINGIVAGPVNSIIKTNAGVVVVEVKALGYMPKKRKVKLLPGKVVKVSATLKKRDNGKDVKDDDYADAAPVEEGEASAIQKAGDGTDGEASAAAGEAGAKSDDDDGGKGPSLALALLPFGVGQFQNGAYPLGGAFLLGEFGGLYYWYSRNAIASAAQKTADSTVASRAASNTPLSQDDQNYLNSNASYVKAQKAQGTYGIALFGVLYFAGVVEAIVDNPITSSPQKKKKKYAGFAWMPDEVDAVPLANASEPYKFDRIGLNLTWDF